MRRACGPAVVVYIDDWWRPGAAEAVPEIWHGRTALVTAGAEPGSITMLSFAMCWTDDGTNKGAGLALCSNTLRRTPCRTLRHLHLGKGSRGRQPIPKALQHVVATLCATVRAALCRTCTLGKGRGATASPHSGSNTNRHICLHAQTAGRTDAKTLCETFLARTQYTQICLRVQTAGRTNAKTLCKT